MSALGLRLAARVPRGGPVTVTGAGGATSGAWRARRHPNCNAVLHLRRRKGQISVFRHSTAQNVRPRAIYGARHAAATSERTMRRIGNRRREPFMAVGATNTLTTTLTCPCPSPRWCSTTTWKSGYNRCQAAMVVQAVDGDHSGTIRRCIERRYVVAVS